MTDVHSPAQRSYNMSRIKGKDTKPERLLRSLLHRAGYRFKKNASDLPGKPDIVLPRYRTAIFVNGCFWHRHPGCRYTTIPVSNKVFWQGKFFATTERDQIKRAQLEAAGWQVITVWECDLKRSAEGVLKDVVDRLERG